MIQSMAHRFAADYAAREDSVQGQGDGRSSIHYPALFLFVGEKSAPAIAPVLASCARKWDNAGGVMALHAIPAEEPGPGGGGLQAGGSGSGLNGRGASAPALSGSGGAREIADKVMTMPLPGAAGRDSRTVRRGIHREFRSDGRYLAEMNRTLRRLSNSIADYGRLYSSFDVIHLSIITRVDDPLNVFLPEIALLTRAVLGQSFKSVQTDLYALISEREQAENFGYSSSIGLAFLRELEMMQSPEYSLTAPLLVTEDGLSIPVSHGPSPLFDLVYVLSDKNERGTMAEGGMEDNYGIISHISLLKNRVRGAGDAARQGGYNNMTFKSGIRGASGRATYASAGFADVKRPNRQIALAVLYHALAYMAGELRSGHDFPQRERQALLGLDSESLRERARTLIPEPEGLSGMTGLMSHGRPSYGELRRMSLREAEARLFGRGGEEYFAANFTAEAARRLEKIEPLQEWRPLLAAREQADPPVTFYQLEAWTADRDDSGSLLHVLRQHMAGLRGRISSLKAELESAYGDSVERQPFQRVPLMDKRTVRNFIHYLFETVYGMKYELLTLETELALCRKLEEGLMKLHSDSAALVSGMSLITEELRAAALSSLVRTADDDTPQNIMEYYRSVTEEVLSDLQSRRGPGILWTEAFMGSMSSLLKQGEEAVVKRLIAVCERELLPSEPFRLPFEEELLRRANVAAAYENRQVMSKEELFKRLYRSLEEGAVIRARLFEYTQEHRHEEKYFFGDGASEFLRYASGADEATRIYRLGVVHEERRSGVSKLNLMGGFHLEDLLYYRNAKVYYETYIENGYELHPEDAGPLPPLR